MICLYPYLGTRKRILGEALLFYHEAYTHISQSLALEAMKLIKKKLWNNTIQYKYNFLRPSWSKLFALNV